MEIKDLSGKDICDIITTCASAQVREFAIGELKITFGPISPGIEASPVGTQEPSQSVEAVDKAKTELDESFIDAIQARTAEDIIQTQSLMDDPEQFEEDVVNSIVYGQKDGFNVTQ